MKRIVLLFIASAFFVSIQAQRDTITVSGAVAKSENVRSMSDQAGLKIFPVPVKDNNFTVSAEKEITTIRITNIIGQEVYRSKYSGSIYSTKVILENQQRGVYLVTVIFSDQSRVVRKIMVEGT